MVSSPRFFSVIFDEGVQAQGAGIRPDHYDLVRIFRLYPGHEPLHLCPDLFRERLGSFQINHLFDSILEKKILLSRSEKHNLTGMVQKVPFLGSSALRLLW